MDDPYPTAFQSRPELVSLSALPCLAVMLRAGLAGLAWTRSGMAAGMERVVSSIYKGARRPSPLQRMARPCFFLSQSRDFWRSTYLIQH